MSLHQRRKSFALNFLQQNLYDHVILFIMLVNISSVKKLNRQYYIFHIKYTVRDFFKKSDAYIYKRHICMKKFK